MSTSTPPAPRLEARGLVLARDGRRVLDGVSLRLAPGELATLTGPSGSGKSTLLRVLATLTSADEGHVLLDGVDAATLAPWAYRTRVAYVLQLPPMLEGTVADNVRVGPGLRGVRLDDAMVVSLLERVGLGPELVARPAETLSGGERQRLALARALANEPAALLLDEPTSALDPAAAERVLSLVRSLAEGGLAVLCVTHSAEHAAALAGTRYVCVAGKLERTTPEAP